MTDDTKSNSNSNSNSNNNKSGDENQKANSGEIRQRIIALFGAEMGKAFTEFCDGNEYDSDGIGDDFAEGVEDSLIVDGMASALGDRKDEFYAKIQAFIANPKRNRTQSQQQPQQPQQRQSKSQPTNVWRILKPSEREAAEDFLERQNFVTFPEESVARVLAIGRHAGVDNFLTLLNDVYTSLRVQKALKDQRERPKEVISDLTIERYVELPYFKQQRSACPKVKEWVLEALRAYGNRLIPCVKVAQHAQYLIDDDLNAYIQYTLVVSTVVANMINTAKHMPASDAQTQLPIQIDLVILPKKTVQGSSTCDFGDGANSGSRDFPGEDSDDDDDDVKRQATTTASRSWKLTTAALEPIRKWNTDQATDDPDTRIKVMSPFQIIGEPTDTIVRRLREFVGELRHKRIVILVDRREEEDVVIAYQMPAKYSQIYHEFSFLQCIAASAGFLFPYVNKKCLAALNTQYVGCRHGNTANFFNVSFMCAAEDNIRAQWSLNGGGVRFYKHYMTDLWPSCFTRASRRAFPLRILPEEIDNRFRLELGNPQFEHWYQRITGRELKTN